MSSFKKDRGALMRLKENNIIFFLTLLLSLDIILSSLNPCHAENSKYTYDDLGRLVRVQYNDGSGIQYAYDKAGNRTEMKLKVVSDGGGDNNDDNNNDGKDEGGGGGGGGCFIESLQKKR